MPKNIFILAEKQSAAKIMGTAFGGMSGKINGDNYVIGHASGHLFEYPDKPSSLVPKALTNKYSAWSLDVLPWSHKDFKWKKKLAANGGRNKKLFDEIKKQVNNIDELVIATDDDPSGEGDVIAWEIIDALNYKGLITRLEPASETVKGYQEAFPKRRLVKSRDTEQKLIRGEIRGKFDYLSMQLTIVATMVASKALKYQFHPVLRQGRLKSVMTYIIGEQEELYNSYVEIPFYTVRFKDEYGYIFKRPDAKEDRKEKESDISLKEWQDSKIIVDKVTKKETVPPKYPDLMGIVAYVSRMGYSSDQVKNTYQKLYQPSEFTDGTGYVSYPRTDNKFIKKGEFEELLPLVDDIARVVGVDPKLLKVKKPRPTHVKDNFEGHGANRPGTRVPKDLKSLEKYGKCAPAIYKYVALSYLATLCENFEYDHQEGYLEKYSDFRGYANVPTKQGFKAILDLEEKEIEQPLGDKAKAYNHRGANPKPQRPTVSFLKDKLEKFNVGTGATRTSTLSDITKAGKTQIVVMDKSNLSLTNLGKKSYLLLKDTNISSPKITEKLFEEMEKAQLKDEDRILAIMEQIVTRDRKIMEKNAPKLLDLREENIKKYSEYPVVEKETAVIDGKEISFKTEWSGYKFSEEEINKLTNGKSITFTTKNKKGELMTVKGNLQEQTFKGKKFWGFKVEEFL